MLLSNFPCYKIGVSDMQPVCILSERKVSSGSSRNFSRTGKILRRIKNSTSIVASIKIMDKDYRKLRSVIPIKSLTA